MAIPQNFVVEENITEKIVEGINEEKEVRNQKIPENDHVNHNV